MHEEKKEGRRTEGDVIWAKKEDAASWILDSPFNGFSLAHESRFQIQSKPKKSKCLTLPHSYLAAANNPNENRGTPATTSKKATMAGGNFMHRVISYVVNEVVVNGLANSPAFQRFAVRTSKKIEDISTKAAQKKEQIIETMKDLSEDIKSKNQ
ncbi:hypothetical protein SLA2020_385610 [Shorea laevis]